MGFSLLMLKLSLYVYTYFVFDFNEELPSFSNCGKLTTINYKEEKTRLKPQMKLITLPHQFAPPDVDVGVRRRRYWIFN